jgi:hypothetical protein
MLSSGHCEAGDDRAGEEEEIKPEDAALVTFILDGECPKCGKVLTRGHAKHLALCHGSGPQAEPDEPTLADLIQLEVLKLEKMEHKLSELEIGGLVDLDDKNAVFMVVGSTGVSSPGTPRPCKGPCTDGFDCF